jgi:Raf kinase inhibitor-like YbhB/YbcL family protein
VTSGQDRIRRPGRRRHRARRIGAAVAAALAVTLVLAGCGNAGSGAAVAPIQMSVSSEAFVQQLLPQTYTCYGSKVNPPLNWSSTPANAKSIAIIVDDSSAPITPFIYWLVFDISPGASDIQQGSRPTGSREAVNSAGITGYDAPCPQGHPHSYRFWVYALNRTINLPDGAPLAQVLAQIEAATIGRGRIVVTARP